MGDDRTSIPRFALVALRHNWNRFARLDPFWAVLTWPEKRGGRWDPGEFYASGVRLIDELHARFAELGVEMRGECALDFGCGVGRIASALRRYYASVLGLDIAEHMLEVARQHVSDPGVRFVHSPRGDLAPVAGQAFDVVTTFITLQHVPPAASRPLIAALGRAVAPGGLLFLQVPTRSHTQWERLWGTSTLKGRVRSWIPVLWLERYREFRSHIPRMDMYGVAEDEVRALLTSAGLTLLAADDVDDTGGLLPSRRYYAMRARSASA